MRTLHLIVCLLVTCPAAAAEALSERIPGELMVQMTIPRSGFSIGFGFDALWMMSDNQLVKVNAADNSTLDIEMPTGEEAASLPDVDRYRGIAIGEGAVWVPDMARSTIYKIDPQLNKVELTIPTDIFGSQGSIGVGEGSVWVITFADHDKTLTRYNATSGSEEARIALPRSSKGVLVDYGSVWVTAASRGELYRIDPKTNQIAATIAIHGPSHLLASGHGSIWIPFEIDGLAQRIDGQTGEVVATIQTGAIDMESGGDIAEGGGFIWIITRGSTVAQIDPNTNSAKGTFRPATGTVMGRRVRWGGGSLWVSGESIFRIKPPD